ncbi:MAG: hypothetical protein AABW89_00750 [Nanoarchaeota archaeon]
MVNQSKANDPRFWKRWRASGAVGTIEDAILKEDTILRIMQDREQRPVCVHVNESAGFWGDTVFNSESGKYEPNTSGRTKLYSYGTNGVSLFGAYIPYAFKIETVPGVGRVAFRQGGTSTTYHTQEGSKPEDPKVANVAGIVVADSQEQNKYGDRFVPVALFDQERDKGLVKITKAFFRKKGITGYVAFQSN